MARILAAIANGLVLETTTRLLRMDGHEVLDTQSGSVALERLRADTFDVIILGNRLEPSSMSVLERIRTADKTASLPVLIVDAGMEDHERQELKMLDAQFLSMPFGKETLSNKVAALVS